MSAVAKTFTNGIALSTKLPFPQTRGWNRPLGGRHWQRGGNEVAVVPFNDATSPRHGGAPCAVLAPALASPLSAVPSVTGSVVFSLSKPEEAMAVPVGPRHRLSRFVWIIEPQSSRRRVRHYPRLPPGRPRMVQRLTGRTLRCTYPRPRCG